ncbi:hypothetical protein [Xenorhabdus bovienii]|uniref:hypothetical protein n=1 Tax=Xenorhabdus bovienii TaxID=40576 RepID=UPI0004DA343D|nr:hypothetical protein [Xenorhabdus bovienii]CDG90179.1 conserved hypothetical protein [Xenorhabdus bovienii str. feltiae France]CDG92051.1 conserved hypothetical protein [Xenorhabdus bovienii str. feltiae Florida]
MSEFSLTIRNWCSLKDGIQTGNSPALTSDDCAQIDEKIVLAGKKLRNIDTQTTKVLCCFDAIKRAGNYDPHAAIISATSMGAFDSVCKLLEESYQNALPYQISPGNIPNTVINSTAGFAAIHYEVDGPNISLCASELSFYEALTKAFAIGKRRPANKIFVSAVESWGGLYGRALNEIRQDEHFPVDYYAALFMLSPAAWNVVDDIAGDKILAVTTGRLGAEEDITAKAVDFINSVGIRPELVHTLNIWAVSQNNLSSFNRYFPHTSITQLSSSAKVLMSGLGAWQLEHLLTKTAANKYGVQIAVDDEGFYGLSIIEKL